MILPYEPTSYQGYHHFGKPPYVINLSRVAPGSTSSIQELVQAAELRERELEAEAVVKYEQREKDFTARDVETSGGFHSHGDTPIDGL